MITPDLSIGSTFGDYRLEAVAGRGGMGVVFRATELALGRTVALKVIASDLAQELDFRQRFQRELAYVVALEHPNVVPVYRAGEVDNVLYIAMRFIRGTDLRELLAERGPLPPEGAGRIITQIGMALDEAHSMGLVHRDVKPANVIVDPRGSESHVYLTDFGLSKHVTSTGALTHPGVWVGTPNYIAPEQVLGMPVNARADVYSLTCLLFETLSGQVPYPRENEMATLFAHVQDEPPSLLRVAPRLPERLEEVIRRGMAKKQEERYPSAGDLAEATAAAIHGRPVVRRERAVAQGRAALSSPDLLLPTTQEYAERAQHVDENLTQARAPQRAKARERMETIVRAQPVEQPSDPGPAVGPQDRTTVKSPVVGRTPPDESGASAPPQAPPEGAPEAPGSGVGLESAVPAPPQAPGSGVGRESGVPAPPQAPPEAPGSGVGRESGVPSRPAEPGDSRPAPETVVRLQRVESGAQDPITGAPTGRGPAPPVPSGGPAQRAGAASPSAAAAVREPPQRAPERPKSRRNLVVAGILVAVLAVAGVAAVLVLGGGEDDGGGGSSDSGGGAQAAELATTTVDEGPTDVVVDGNGAWVASTTAGTVSRLDLSTGKVDGRPIRVGGAPDRLASDGESLFVLDSTDGVIYAIDEAAGRRTGEPWRFTADDLAAGFDSMWVVNGTTGRLRRVDPTRVAPTTNIAVGDHPISVAVGESTVVVVNGDGGTLSRVDPETDERVEPDPQVGKDATDVAAAGDTAWVTNPGEGRVVRIDDISSDDPQETSIAVPDATFVAVGEDAVWVVGSGGLTRIDPKTNQTVGDPVELGFVGEVAASDDDVWVVNPGANTVVRVPY